MLFAVLLGKGVFLESLTTSSVFRPQLLPSDKLTPTTSELETQHSLAGESGLFPHLNSEQKNMRFHVHIQNSFIHSLHE